MSVVLHEDGSGRAVIFNRATGAVLPCSAPTALENVANGGGIWVHGAAGEPWDGPVKAAPAVEPEPEAPAPSLTLEQEDVLPLPAGEVGINETAVVNPAAPETAPPPPAAEAVNEVKPSPLDHDGDGKPGGSKARKPADPERVALFAALDAKRVKYFKGATTEALKAKLAAA